MVTRLLTLAGAVLLLMSPAPALAGGSTFNVTKTADTNDGTCDADCSLREAIEDADGVPGTDVVNVPAGTYTLTQNQLTVNDGVFINGAGAGSTVITAGGNSRVLQSAIQTAGPVTTIRDVTITGGATGDLPVGGGGLLNTDLGGMVVQNSVVTGNSFTATDNSSAGGGGIANHSGGGLSVIDSTVSDNQVVYDNAPTGGTGRGGGGIQATAGTLTILRSTISGNTVEEIAVTAPAETGGGGIYAIGPFMEITNSTVSGNRATVGSGTDNGGGGIFFDGITQGLLAHATLAGNSTNGDGGGVLDASQGNLNLSETIVANNTSQSPATSGCAGNVVTGDFNMEFPGNTCGLGASDFPNTDPQLGPLASNGGPTATHALAPTSPAIDRRGDSQSCQSLQQDEDQRGVARPKGNACEIGAYEFDGLSSASGAPCFTGPVGISLLPPAGAAATAVRARIDGGPETSGAAGGSPPGALVGVPDGSHTLEYWGDFTSGQELAHHTANVLVDTAPPVVSVTSDQGHNGYTVGERASFSVRASDQGTGLASNPSASRQRIDTSRPGTRTISRAATDACGNSTTASLRVRVLPVPEYGEEVNLFPAGGVVTVRLPGPSRTGARTSQKGQGFIPLQQARQVPVGTFVNTRRGRVRLVSSRAPNSRRIQAGEFFSGLFQVFQARSRRARGLTTLTLKGSSFRSCRRGGRGKRASAAQSRIRRRLRANARGRFRTRGRHSAATVRGTVWLTADRCDGTLTRVNRGRVAVRDFRRKRTILVRAGKSYLAKAPR